MSRHDEVPATIRSGPPARSPAEVRGRLILLSLGLLLPTLSLVPLGGLYLWDRGWLLWWALAALSAVGLIVFLERRLIWPASRTVPPGEALTQQTQTYSPREEAAWRDVLDIAQRIEPDKLDSQQAVIDLGLSTVETVARRLHPEKDDPLWQFTMPEALAISERVSRRLAGFVTTHIPFGDRLTLANFFTVYRWRGALGVAEKAYDVWRILRLANPVTAATNEARERLSRAMLQYGKEHVTRQLAAGFVEEVGRAAIDLYGGRLRVVGAPSVANGNGAAGTVDGTSGATALEVLILARSATAGATLAADLEQLAGGRAAPGLAVRVIVGSTEPDAAVDEAVAALDRADLVLWLIGDETEPSHAALSTFAGKLAASADRLPPVIVAVAAQARAAPPLPRPLEVRKTVVVDLEAENGEARQLDLAALLASVEHAARRVHYVRMLQRSKSDGSWILGARQAASAAFNLARSAVRRRDGTSDT